MDKRNVLSSPRLLELKQKKRKIFIRKLIIFGVLFFIVLIGLSLATRISRLNINEIEVVGNKVIDTEKIQEVARGEMSGYYAWLFPKTNLFLYPKTKIKNKLSDAHKRLTDIDVSVSRQKMIVSVSERSPEYTWCGEVPPVEEKEEECFFLDKEGYIFDEAPYFSGEVYFKFYGIIESKSDKKIEEVSGGALSPTGQYVALGYFEKLIALKNVLKEIDLSPIVIYIEEGENLKIFLSRDQVLTNGPYVTIKKNSDFQKMAENLKAAIETDPLKSKFKNEYSKLEYIDLRFGNKVYYKFK